MTTVATQPSETVKPPENGATQVAVRRTVSYEPMAPIGSAGGLKALMTTMKDSIAEALPRHVTPERLIKTLLVAANRNPTLLQCTQASILETINRAAELGLDLSGTLGEAYPVPFQNSVKDAQGNWHKHMQCTLIIGYRGLEKLVWQSGEVQMIDAEVVCANDKFVFKKGFDPKLEWEPCMNGDRGEVIGAYALIITKLGGKMARFMTKADIDKIRAGAKSKDSPAWVNHYSEMARKTALRRVLKDAPLSTEKMTAAMEHDDTDYKLQDVLEAEVGLRGLPAGRASFTTPVAEPEPDGQGTEPIADAVAAESAKLDQRRAEVQSADDAAKSQPKEEPAKPERSKEDIKADLDRVKHGCRVGTPGCSSDISIDPKTKKGVCSNHAKVGGAS